MNNPTEIQSSKIHGEQEQVWLGKGKEGTSQREREPERELGFPQQEAHPWSAGRRGMKLPAATAYSHLNSEKTKHLNPSALDSVESQGQSVGLLSP